MRKMHLFDWRACLVQVSLKDIPSRVDSLNQEQQNLAKSLSAEQGDRDVPTLKMDVAALKTQVTVEVLFVTYFVSHIFVFRLVHEGRDDR